MSEPTEQPAPDGDPLDEPVDDAVRRFADPLRKFLEHRPSYHLTRFVFLRFLGAVYLVAFLVAANQFRPLLGHDGLLPIDAFLAHVLATSSSKAAAVMRVPTLFWLGDSDRAIAACAWLGVALSALVVAGVTNAFVQLALWALYSSFVHTGQIFYGYGWEIQLLETGFLAIFFCPLGSLAPMPASAPPRAVVWLLRWLIVRIMLGAGLIKLRGDPCWRDLTCLVYHYETQPVPNPLSWLLHQAPVGFHKAGVAFNHLVELVAPFFAFGPRRARHVAGGLMLAFQASLIASGNLSFLNWLTIAPAIACFDDDLLARIVPSRLAARARQLADSVEPSLLQRRVGWGLIALIAFLSVAPVANLLSNRQAMNRAFEPLSIVNTYGAFGSVGRERFEVIVEGTRDATLSDATEWQAYELPCKPGDVRRRPCVITPYHYRLDWQMWFLPFGSYEDQPWIVHLVYQLLRGDRAVRGLFARDPFGDRPPTFIRAELYRYEFTRLGDGDPAWWRRQRVGEYMRPLSVDDPALVDALDAFGWRHE